MAKQLNSLIRWVQEVWNNKETLMAKLNITIRMDNDIEDLKQRIEEEIEAQAQRIQEQRQRIDHVGQRIQQVTWEIRQIQLRLDIAAMHQADNTTMTRPRRIPFSAN